MTVCIELHKTFVITEPCIKNRLSKFNVFFLIFTSVFFSTWTGNKCAIVVYNCVQLHHNMNCNSESSLKRKPHFCCFGLPITSSNSLEYYGLIDLKHITLESIQFEKCNFSHRANP
jgi:hypothetical protein